MRRIGLLVFAALALVACGGDGVDTDERENVATEWYLRSIDPDGRTVQLVYTMSGVASGCEREASASVEQTADKVVVTAYKSVSLDTNRACTEEFAYIEESVTLDEPLGDRPLVGCRPGKVDTSEDEICRDLERSRERGIFEFSPQPSG